MPEPGLGGALFVEAVVHRERARGPIKARDRHAVLHPLVAGHHTRRWSGEIAIQWGTSPSFSVNLHGYRGTVVANGFAVYEVLGRDGPAFTLAHCWSHAKRKQATGQCSAISSYDEIGTLIGQLYAIERLVPGAFPGDEVAQSLRRQLRQERSRVLDRIWQWATVQGASAERFREG